MKGIYKEIYRVKDKDENEVIPIIIVGNKCDLENERQVTKEDGIEYANSVKCAFLECSAKTNENINQIFDIITRNVVEYKYSTEEEIWTIEKPKKEKGCCLIYE
ncbi:Ras family gtpase [Entamoeba histolytica KU27]|uniref:Ras family gtpase n=1 Tax=Entamoeba histolytica KU27 TaxID=885311 RepID=M2RUA9_ENTHI|nr:Ras family gtpase [Entamoeba histolytica KU27]